MSLPDVSNEWVVICRSDEIGVEAARACVVEDKQLVVWRDGESGVHVWDDRCPHRGLALSEGSVSGGLLTCPAHGWRFDTNGQWVRPLTSSTPTRQAVCTTVYAAREQDGVISAYLAQAAGLGHADIDEDA